MDLFFKYGKSMFKKRDPFIIEIGFNIFFLLREMEQHLKYELDQDYLNRVISLLPKQNKLRMQVNHNIFVESMHFIKDVIMLIFSYLFICFGRSKTINHSKIKKIQNNSKLIRKTILFYAMNSTLIEIQKNGVLHPFYFPKLPYCFFRIDDDKLDFINTVNNSNAKTKCEDLSRNSGFLLISLKIDYILRTRLGAIIGLFPKYVELWKNYLVIISLVLNIIIILSYTEQFASKLHSPRFLFDILDNPVDEYTTEWIIRGIGIVSACLAFVMFILVVLTRLSINYRKLVLQKKELDKIE